MSTTSTQMGLQVPSVGDPSPGYAQNIADALFKLDGHDHSSGAGSKVTQNGLNITGALGFNGQSVSNARSVMLGTQVSPLSSPADNGSIFNYNGDLYYLNGNNALIRLTSTAGVAGGITGDYAAYPNAQISYVNADLAYYFRDSANNFAKLGAGSIALGSALGSMVSLTSTGSGVNVLNSSGLAASLSASALYLSGAGTIYASATSVPFTNGNTGVPLAISVGDVNASGAVSALGGVTKGSRIIALRGVVKSSALTGTTSNPITVYNDGATPAFQQITFVPPFAGSVAALTARSYGATGTAGTMVVATSGLGVNASSPTGASAPAYTAINTGYSVTFAPGVYTFSAGTSMTINLNTTSWAQTTTGATGVEAYLWVYC